MAQQAAQHRQQANTVYVAAPKAGDTVTVRVVSGTEQVGDTLHAVVRQTGGEGYVIGNLVLSAILIVVTVILQARSNKLQRDLKDGPNASVERLLAGGRRLRGNRSGD